MQIPVSFLKHPVTRPNEIPVLHLWLKSDAGVSLSGNEVTSWVDQSANAFRFNPLSTSRPAYVDNAFNELPALSFTAGTDYLDQASGSSLDFKYLHDGTTNYTVFFVGKKNTAEATTNYPIFSTGRSTSNVGAYLNATQSNTQIRHTIIRGVAGTQALNNISNFSSWNTTSGLGIYCVTHAPAMDVNCIYLGNVPNSTAGKLNPYSSSSPFRVMSIGSLAINEKGGWDMCELIIYKDVSEANRQGVYNYLRAKWGISQL